VEASEARAAVLTLIEEAGARFPPADAFERVRYFLRWQSLWLPFGHELMRRVGRARELARARLEIEEFFSRPQQMSARSALLG
jgi:hypothetical protein